MISALAKQGITVPSDAPFKEIIPLISTLKASIRVGTAGFSNGGSGLTLNVGFQPNIAIFFFKRNGSNPYTFVCMKMATSGTNYNLGSNVWGDDRNYAVNNISFTSTGIKVNSNICTYTEDTGTVYYVCIKI